MRHSTIHLTMNTYTDPKLLDIRGAIDALPDPPLDARTTVMAAGTGTGGGGAVPTKKPQSGLDSGCQQVETNGLEPSTPSLQSRAAVVVTGDDKGLGTRRGSVGPSVGPPRRQLGTSEDKPSQRDRGQRLGLIVHELQRALSPVELAELVKLLFVSQH
jgi:hypothetical protein